MKKKVCQRCGGRLDYHSDVAAPGFGKTYTCAICQTPHWVLKEIAVEWSEVENIVFEEN